uniref:Reverse transcriptase zinc-binding domain-containing protein n=1 Tax=Setaria viridis TaxID=4556 RepID=A0A4V6DD95_SETVI|nr:hypothetical protein SEVIR_1G279400v2 [Setaria viridis]
MQETAVHLCLHCAFATQVWEQIRDWSNDRIQLPILGCTIEEWWTASLRSLMQKQRRLTVAVLMYTGWKYGRKGIDVFLKDKRRHHCKLRATSRRRLDCAASMRQAGCILVLFNV